MNGTGMNAQDRRSSASAPAVSTAVGMASDQEIVELEELLQHLLSEHEELLALAGTHRQAIQNADPATLGECVQRQTEVTKRVGALESRRLALVSRLAEKMKPLQRDGRAEGAVPDRPTITSIARGLAEPVRTRLVALADRLRELLARLQREHAALREASAALAAHMEGLMRQMAKKLSHAGTYGRRGLVESRVQVVSALDLRS